MRKRNIRLQLTALILLAAFAVLCTSPAFATGEEPDGDLPAVILTQGQDEASAGAAAGEMATDVAAAAAAIRTRRSPRRFRRIPDFLRRSWSCPAATRC